MTHEMTDKQKELFEDLTSLQQKVAINVISGMNPSEAHREAGGVCKNEENRRTLASQILANTCVKMFLDSFSYQFVNEAIMSRESMMETLSAIGCIDSSEFSLMNSERLAELKDGINAKLKAMKQLAEMAGYNAASKHDHVSSDGSMTPKGRNLDDFYADSQV